ncbi:MAG: hypothetical protein ACRDNF_16095 [Streptosporangiaceae bacterium]
MLSLGVLVAAFAGLAGWAAYISVRLYRACPAGRARSPRLETGASLTAADATPVELAEDETPSPHPVA